MEAFFVVEKVVQRTIITTSIATGVATAIAGAPEPSHGSNIIHTKTPFGRGWDAKPGDVFSKFKTMKLQEVIGDELLVNKLEELSSGKKIVTRDIYQKLLQDSDIKEVLEQSNLSNEELYMMGVKEIVTSAAKDSVEAGITSIRQKVNNEIQAIKDVVKNKVDGLIDHATQGSLEPLPEDWSQDKQDMSEDMSETEFQEKQKYVAENSPGKRAVKDQDLIDARKRLRKK